MDNIEAMPTAVNYALLEEALTAFEAVKKLLTTAQVALSLEINLEILGKLLRHLTALSITPVAKNNELTRLSLELLNSGIFQLLPYSAYHRQMNNFQNRL